MATFVFHGVESILLYLFIYVCFCCIILCCIHCQESCLTLGGSVISAFTLVHLVWDNFIQGQAQDKYTCVNTGASVG